MNIVKEINGLKIERREHNRNEYFVIWFEDGGFFKAYSLDEAVEYAMTF